MADERMAEWGTEQCSAVVVSVVEYDLPAVHAVTHATLPLEVPQRVHPGGAELLAVSFLFIPHFARLPQPASSACMTASLSYRTYDRYQEVRLDRGGGDSSSANMKILP